MVSSMKRTVIKIYAMKNIAFLITVFLFTYSCKSQSVYPLGTTPENIQDDNYYVKDINNIYDQVVGVWRWESGNSSFEMTLQEFEQNPLKIGSSKFRDRVFGKYKLIENGTLIAEVTAIPNAIQDQPKIYVGYKSTDTFHIQITDIISGKYKVGEIILNSDGTATMTLQDPIGSSGLRSPNAPPPNNLGFQLPTNITLIKIQ